MKSLFLFIIIGFLFSCSPQKSNTVDQQGIADSASAKNAVVTKYHAIPFDSVCIDIRDLLAVNNLNNTVRSYTFGGFIPASSLKKILINIKTDTPDTAVAVRFYPCFDQPNGKVFLSWVEQETVEPSANNLCDIDPAKTYYQSRSEFNWKNNSIDYNAVVSFLASQNNRESSDLPLPVDVTKLQNYCTHFQELYNYTSSDPHNTRNGSSCGAIYYNDLRELIEQPGHEGEISGIRYFFGFDKNRKCNNVRIIFIAVAADGTNLLIRSNNVPATMIQKDWPPPTKC